MKKYDVQKFELLSNEQIADGIFDMRVKNDELAPLAKCGQFAHVYVPSKTLRRPISVCDSENGVLRLVYQVKGEGTKIMSEMKKGEAVDILAPLGNGFNIEKGKRYCLIGGGKFFANLSNCLKHRGRTAGANLVNFIYLFFKYICNKSVYACTAVICCKYKLGACIFKIIL